MSRADPANLLRMYEKGVLTLKELETRLIEAAATHPVEEIAILLSAELLSAIKERTASPPTDPDGHPGTVWIGHWSEEDRRTLWEGECNWHRYFKSCRT